jgi:hypothetical protein
MSFAKKFCSKSPFKHGDGSWGGRKGSSNNPANAEIIAAQQVINDKMNATDDEAEWDSLHAQKQALAAKLVKD